MFVFIYQAVTGNLTVTVNELLQLVAKLAKTIHRRNIS